MELYAIYHDSTVLLGINKLHGRIFIMPIMNIHKRHKPVFLQHIPHQRLPHNLLNHGQINVHKVTTHLCKLPQSFHFLQDPETLAENDTTLKTKIPQATIMAILLVII